MIKMDNPQEIIKIIRKYIHDVIGINLKDIRDSTSLYGEDLLKVLEGKKYNSYKLSDSVVLLNLETRNNSSDMAITQDDSTIYYRSYQLKVYIYGDSAINIGNKIYAVFNSDYILSNLLEEGIYVEEITSPTLINEFVNEVMWPRCDLDFNISVMHKYDNLLKYEMDKSNDISIVKNE